MQAVRIETDTPDGVLIQSLTPSRKEQAQARASRFEVRTPLGSPPRLICKACQSWIDPRASITKRAALSAWIAQHEDCEETPV